MAKIKIVSSKDVFDPKQNPKMDLTAEFAMKNLPDFEKKKEKKK